LSIVTIDIDNQLPSNLDAKDIARRYGAELVELETLRYGLLEVARDMHESLVRSSFSPIVRDIQDCTAAIHMRTDAGWETVASREGAMQHAFTAQHMCNFLMEEWDEASLQPGDTIFVNDPWRGAIHQSDVNLFRPIIIDGRVEFVLHSTSHVLDLGGAIPGGFANGVQTHFEEQLKFPPTLLYAGDVAVRSAFNYILENTRVPSSLLGDLRALYGCLAVGDVRLRELVDRFGLATVRAGGQYGTDRIEQSMRAAISAVPDGDYAVEDFIDEDGVTDEELRIAATVRVRGDSIEVDFSGTGRQPLGNVGTAWIESTRCVQGIKMVLDPHSPVNSGTLRPIESLLPPGSAVCVLPPSSVSNHLDIGSRNINMMTTAMSMARPELGVAPDNGNFAAMMIGGFDDRPGHEGPWAGAILPGGAWGGTYKSDGLTSVTPAIGACRSSVWEHIERESPIVPLMHEFLPDSAGAGFHRGGFGGIFTLLPLATTYATITGDRSKRGAPGVNGGGPGFPFYAWLVPADDPGIVLDPFDLRGCEPLFGVFDEKGRPLPGTGEFGRGARYQTAKVAGLEIKPGQALRVLFGGGGGWGDPLERPVDRVRADVEQGLYSPEFVERAYGVVISSSGEVDAGETTRLRAELRDARKAGTWSVPTACPTNWIV
jgi:N-methylhydantoinase B